MNRDEFLRQFREALVGKVPESVINENAAYYRNYINNQVSSGMSEEDVLRSLGDPRLLAKTIEESSKFTRENSAEYEQAVYGEQTVYGNDIPYMRHKVTTVPLWLGILIAIAIVVIIIVAVFNIFVALLPFILVGVIVSVLYRIVKSMFR